MANAGKIYVAAAVEHQPQGMLAGVLFGLFPSLNATRPDLVDALRASGEFNSPAVSLAG